MSSVIVAYCTNTHSENNVISSFLCVYWFLSYVDFFIWNHSWHKYWSVNFPTHAPNLNYRIMWKLWKKSWFISDLICRLAEIYYLISSSSSDWALYLEIISPRRICARLCLSLQFIIHVNCKWICTPAETTLRNRKLIHFVN